MDNTKKRNLILVGGILIGIAFVLSLIIYGPLIEQEAQYSYKVWKTPNAVAGASDLNTLANLEGNPEEYTLVIPKIDANAAIVENVDPFNAAEYQLKLTQGIAHAKGSAQPGEVGNVFLFAHSSDNPINASRYNAVFFLLNKLEPDDKIYIFRDGEKFEYSVQEKKVVKPEQVEYIQGNKVEKQLTLMTCWPAGTNFGRLLVIAELNEKLI